MNTPRLRVRSSSPLWGSQPPQFGQASWRSQSPHGKLTPQVAADRPPTSDKLLRVAGRRDHLLTVQQVAMRSQPMELARCRRVRCTEPVNPRRRGRQRPLLALASVCRSRLWPWVSKCVRGVRPSSAAAVPRRRPPFPPPHAARPTCRFEQGEEKKRPSQPRPEGTTSPSRSAPQLNTRQPHAPGPPREAESPTTTHTHQGQGLTADHESRAQ